MKAYPVSGVVEELGVFVCFLESVVVIVTAVVLRCCWCCFV